MHTFAGLKLSTQDCFCISELLATTAMANRPNLLHLENTMFAGLFSFGHILADIAIAVHIKLGYRLSPDGIQSLTVDTENTQTDVVL